MIHKSSGPLDCRVSFAADSDWSQRNFLSSSYVIIIIIRRWSFQAVISFLPASAATTICLSVIESVLQPSENVLYFRCTTRVRKFCSQTGDSLRVRVGRKLRSKRDIKHTRRISKHSHLHSCQRSTETATRLVNISIDVDAWPQLSGSWASSRHFACLCNAASSCTKYRASIFLVLC